MGIPITDDVWEKIFPEDGTALGRGVRRKDDDIRKVTPAAGHGSREFLVVLRELAERTRRTAAVENLRSMGRKLLGLEVNVRYWQVTLVRTDVHPHESYTALAPAAMVESLQKGVMVGVKIVARSRGDHAYWVVSDIEVI